ncbi:MAG: hypothetical protein OIN85_10530 [Candidatus Methanoperedens sp.]|nr:hypothetical protein [Candidatus Methanoperedens sp.]
MIINPPIKTGELCRFEFEIKHAQKGIKGVLKSFFESSPLKQTLYKIVKNPYLILLHAESFDGRVFCLRFYYNGAKILVPLSEIRNYISPNDVFVKLETNYKTTIKGIGVPIDEYVISNNTESQKTKKLQFELLLKSS